MNFFHVSSAYQLCVMSQRAPEQVIKLGDHNASLKYLSDEKKKYCDYLDCGNTASTCLLVKYCESDWLHYIFTSDMILIFQL